MDGEGQLYWSDRFAGEIWRAKLDGTGRTKLVTGLDGPIGPALDLASGQMYWVDQNAGLIRRANLDGTGLTTLVRGQAAPVAPALDLGSRQMYWADYGGGDIRLPEDGVQRRNGCDT